MNSRFKGLVTILTVALACNGFSAELPEPMLRLARPAIVSLDPVYSGNSSIRAVLLVYQTLLAYDYEARPYRLKPYAAASMPECSPDGRTYTFRLREDAVFGPDACFPGGSRAMTAEDVIYSFKRIADAKLSSPGWWIFDGKVVGLNEFREASRNLSKPTDYDSPVAGLRALDARTLQIELTRPMPDFLWGLALSYSAVVPREAVEYYGDKFGLREVGSGPYKLESWRRGHRLCFTQRHPEVFAAMEKDGRTYYRSIVYLEMADASTRWLSFLRGDFDMATEISRDNWDAVIDKDGELRDEMKAQDIRLMKGPTLETCYLGINMDDPVLGKNPALRRALSCAFNTAEWVSLNRGRVSPANGPIPPGISSRLDTPHPYAYNLEKARALMAEAGYPNGIDPATGQRLRLTLSMGRADQESREGAELIVSFFDKIGINLSLDIRTFPNFIQHISSRNAQLFMLTWLADYPDAVNFLQLFYSKNASPGPNRTNFCNAEYDRLFEHLLVEQNPEVRNALCQKLQHIIRDQVPWVCLYYCNELVLLQPRLQGFKLHDFPWGNEKYWYVK